MHFYFIDRAIDAHLHQTMGLQFRIDSFDHRFGEAFAADRHDRAEVMGRGAVFAALGGAEFEGRENRHLPIIGAATSIP